MQTASGSEAPQPTETPKTRELTADHCSEEAGAGLSSREPLTNQQLTSKAGDKNLTLCTKGKFTVSIFTNKMLPNKRHSISESPIKVIP